MNILFITDLCPISDDEFGLPSTLLDFILGFIQKGHNVTLLRPNIIPNILLRKRKILKEGKYYYKGIKAINKNFLTPFFKPDDFKFLIGEKFDIILSHMPSGILAGAQVSKLLNIPYCTAVHSSDIKVLSDIKYSFLWHSIKSAYMGASAVLPRSYWLKEKIEKIIPNLSSKITLIPSGIDPKDVILEAEFDKKFDILCHPIKIFSAGQLIKRKNFELLINSIKDIEGVTLEIAGDGPNKPALISLIKKHNLQNKVQLLGKLSREEIYKKMEETPVFALLSKDETFGMVYLEALSKGCLVICSKNSGMAGFIVDNENGFLIDPDKKSLKDTIFKIINLKNKKEIAKNARRLALSLSLNNVVENYINAFKNIFFKI